MVELIFWVVLISNSLEMYSENERNIGGRIKPQGLVLAVDIYIFFTVDWVLQLILIMPVERARILARFFFHFSLSVSPIFFPGKKPTRAFLHGIGWSRFYGVRVFRLRLICVCKTVLGNLNTPAKAVKLDIYIHMHIYITYTVPTYGYDADAGITFRVWILNSTQISRS